MEYKQVDTTEGKYFSDQEWSAHQHVLEVARGVLAELAVENGLSVTGDWRGYWPSCGIKSKRIFGKNIWIHISLEGEKKKRKPKHFFLTVILWSTFFGIRVKSLSSETWPVAMADLKRGAILKERMGLLLQQKLES